MLEEGRYLSYAHKIYRVREHLRLLYDELTAHIRGGEFYKIVDDSEVKPAADGMRRAKISRRVVFVKDIPVLRLGVLVGDVISNLRSALDHVVYAVSFSRDPDEFRDDRSTFFPIRDDPQGFTRRRRKEWEPLHEIRGIPPEAQAFIEGLQPYHGDNVSEDPLCVLREMSNIDKHRSIHLAAFSAIEVAWDITRVLHKGVTIHSHMMRPPGKLESGAVIAELDVSAPDDLREPIMEMNRQFFFTVAFEEGRVPH